MGYVVAILISLALLAGFLLLTRFETRRGTRFFSVYRAALDARTERAMFIFTHVDFESFVKEQSRLLFARVAHDIAHLSLLVVRAVERLLTRLVKHLRIRHGVTPVKGIAPR